MSNEELFDLHKQYMKDHNLSRYDNLHINNGNISIIYDDELNDFIDGILVNAISIWHIEGGVPHCLNNAAVIFNSGKKLWYYKGKYINCQSQKEFEKILKLKAFL